MLNSLYILPALLNYFLIKINSVVLWMNKQINTPLCVLWSTELLLKGMTLFGIPIICGWFHELPILWNQVSQINHDVCSVYNCK